MTGHGGARPRAGRPVTTGPTVRGVMIYLRPELHAAARDVLDVAAGENLSRLIAQLLTAEIAARKAAP